MKNYKGLILHSVIGLFIGYFLIHPISMVIYWFEFNTNETSMADLINVFFNGFKHAFSLHMMPMSVSFSILGAFIGLGSGMYYKSINYWTLKKKNKDGFQQRIILLISNAFGKDICPKVHISFYEIEGKEICILFIEPASRAVYFNEGNSTIFFLRTGNVTLALTTSETVKYLNSRKIK